MISPVFPLVTKLHTKAKCLKSMALKHFIERQCICLIQIWKLPKKGCFICRLSIKKLEWFWIAHGS